jgi:hypothetical protein
MFREEDIMTSRYAEVYESWRSNPEGFWMDQAAAIDWFTKPEIAFDPDLGVYGGWYPDGVTNTCHNCLDRHVSGGRGDQAALIYDSPITGSKRTISYNDMLAEVEAFAGALSRQGRRQGRPGGHLHADGAGSHRGNAGLCAAWRRPFGGVWRLCRFGACHPNRGCQAKLIVSRLLRHRTGPDRGLQAAA